MQFTSWQNISLANSPFNHKSPSGDVGQKDVIQFYAMSWEQLFLSDPSPIIGNACHSLTHSCLVNFIDVTLACEDGNSKLVEVVTVVEVDDEKRVDNSLVQIWKVNFGHKVKFLFRL